MGASFILVALAWDLKTALARFPIERCFTVAAVGIVIYAGIGLLAMALGGSFWTMHIWQKYYGKSGNGPLSSHAGCGN